MDSLLPLGEGPAARRCYREFLAFHEELRRVHAGRPDLREEGEPCDSEELGR